MKPTLFFFLLFLISATAKSQLDQGTWLVGGSGSLYSYSEEYTSPSTSFNAKYSNISIDASIGYFIINKFNMGLRPTFSSFKGEVNNGGKTNSYQIAAGPYCRYYFLKLEKPFNVLTDISYLIGINRYLGALHEKGKFNTLSIKGGIEAFFNSSVGLEILLGYSQNITTIDDSPGAFKSNKSGFRASIGFQIHLQKL